MHLPFLGTLLLSLLLPAYVAAKQPLNLSMGSRRFMVGGACVEMTASIENLDKIRTRKDKSQVRFVSGRKQVFEFPEDILVWLMATDCAQPWSLAGAPVFNRLKFSARWERDGQFRQVEGASFPHIESPQPWPELGPVSAFNADFICIFSKGVPLADKLVITVHALDGTALADFQSQLY
jgi:hypothetical protein